MAAVLVGGGLAGCSGGSDDESSDASSSSSSESSSSAPSTEPSESATVDAPGAPAGDVSPAITKTVLERLDASDGLFGTPFDGEPPVMSLERFNQGAPPSQTKALQQRGFVAGAYERVEIPETSDAIRIVIRFEDEKGAAADVASGSEDLGGQGLTKKFDVPGVPGAEGYDVFGQQGLVGRNIAFNIGEYEYIVGFAATQPKSKEQPTREAFAGLAKDWYDEARRLG